MYSVHCTAILLDIALIYVFFYLLIVTYACTKYVVETIQDFLIKLGIKPLMHLLEIHISSLNDDTSDLPNEQSRQKLGTFVENKVL